MVQLVDLLNRRIEDELDHVQIEVPVAMWVRISVHAMGVHSIEN